MNLYEETAYNDTDWYHLIDHITYFDVKLWNMDLKSNSHINISDTRNV